MYITFVVNVNEVCILSSINSVSVPKKQKKTKKTLSMTNAVVEERTVKHTQKWTEWIENYKYDNSNTSEGSCNNRMMCMSTLQCTISTAVHGV